MFTTQHSNLRQRPKLIIFSHVEPESVNVTITVKVWRKCTRDENKKRENFFFPFFFRQPRWTRAKRERALKHKEIIFKFNYILMEMDYSVWSLFTRLLLMMKQHKTEKWVKSYLSLYAENNDSAFRVSRGVKASKVKSVKFHNFRQKKNVSSCVFDASQSRGGEKCF